MADKRTLLSYLDNNSKYHRDRLDSLIKAASVISRKWPGMLAEMEVPQGVSIADISPTTLAFSIQSLPEDMPVEERQSIKRASMAFMGEWMDRFNVSSVEKSHWTNGSEVALYDQKENFTVLFMQRRAKPCHKIRVTHVIEVCGTVDPSQYEKVEEIE